jgi:hypothetical protein
MTQWMNILSKCMLFLKPHQSKVWYVMNLCMQMSIEKYIKHIILMMLECFTITITLFNHEMLLIAKYLQSGSCYLSK